jgi:hypothetical protein
MADEMNADSRQVPTVITNNSGHTNPPLSITEAQLAEGLERVDRSLKIADQAVRG